MRICDACHVHVRGSMDRCPLCGTKLRGEKEENVFPRLQMYDHMYRKIMRIFLFLSVIAVIVCLAANRVFVPDLFWSMLCWLVWFLSGSACMRHGKRNGISPKESYGK